MGVAGDRTHLHAVVFVVKQRQTWASMNISRNVGQANAQAGALVFDTIHVQGAVTTKGGAAACEPQYVTCVRKLPRDIATSECKGVGQQRGSPRQTKLVGMHYRPSCHYFVLPSCVHPTMLSRIV